MPLVSILISAYNVEKYVEESVESVLNQTHRNIEILIVDDGSTDETPNILKKFTDTRIRYYSQANKGKAATINDLIDIAKGQFMVIHDSDDISKPNRVEVLLETFKKNPSIGMAMSSYSLLINGKEIAPKPKAVSIEECQKKINNYSIPSHDATIMVKRDLLKKEKYDGSLKLVEGIDLILRIGEKNNIIVTEKILYEYRIHPDSITKTTSNERAKLILQSFNKARIRRGLNKMSLNDFLKKYFKYLKHKDNNLAGHFTESAYLLQQKGKRIEAIKVGLYALIYLIHGPRYLKPIIYALVPRFIAYKGKKIFGRK